MLTATQIGTVGETAVKLHFLKMGYEVFIGDDNTSCDMIVLNTKTNEMKRVEVKTTRIRTRADTGWTVGIRKKKRGSHGIPFDNSKVELLVIYVEPVDKIIIFDSKDIKTTCNFIVRDSML